MVPSATLRYLPVFINWLNLPSTLTGSAVTSNEASVIPDTSLPKFQPFDGSVFLSDTATPSAPNAPTTFDSAFEKSRPAET